MSASHRIAKLYVSPVGRRLMKRRLRRARRRAERRDPASAPTRIQELKRGWLE